MGNLSNLYVSKSFQSLIHLGTDSSATSTLTTLQDGLGNSIGIEVNTAGNLFLSGSLTASLQQGYVWVGNASGKTTTVSTSSFGGGGTTPAGTISSSAQITALGFVSSSITASSLITASFNNGTRNLTFTKGDNSTFSVNIPDVSGSAGNFVTTSSFNSYTASTDSSISQLNASSASQQVSINNLNTTTASLLIETQNLETFSASALVSISNLNSATSSLFTSASLALTTASVSGTTMTFTKGNGTTFNVTLPTGSGGGTINTGSFATTGSNSFNGDQTVTGSIRYSQQLQVGTANLGPTIQALPSGTPLGDTGLQVNAGESGSFSMRTLYGGGIGTATLEAYNTFPNPTTGGKIFAKSGGGAEIQGVGGNVSISGSNTTIQGLRYPITDGTNGQVITTNGSGVLTFTTVSGGSINTGSFAITGSNTFIGNQTITGSVTISGSATNDLVIQGRALISTPTSGQTPQLEVSSSLGRSVLSRGGIFAIDSTGTNLELSTGTDGAAYLALWNATGTEIGFNLSPSSSGYVTGWSGGPSIYVNDGPSNWPAAIGFQSAANYTDGTVTILKPLDISGSLDIQNTLTASLQQGFTYVGNSAGRTTTVSTASFATTGSNIFTGNQIITGSNQLNIRGGGEEQRLGPGFQSISGSSHRNLLGPRAITISKPSFDFPVFEYVYTGISSSYLTNFTDNLSATASYTVGVFDNGFTQDVELSLETTTTNGILFKDIRSDTGAYTTFLKIAPNGGSNPPLEFKRGMQITGSLSIQSGSGMPSQIGTSLVTWNSATGQIGQATTATLISSSFSAGEFYSMTTLSGSAGVSASIALPNTAISNGVSIQSGSQIVVQNTGTYNIQFSAQVDAFSNADTIWIWFKKNGTNIADSASKLIMQNNTAAIMTVNIFDNAVPNDYYEIVWQNNAGHGKIISDVATGNIPGIPSVIATVNQVK